MDELTAGTWLLNVQSGRGTVFEEVQHLCICQPSYVALHTAGAKMQVSVHPSRSLQAQLVLFLSLVLSILSSLRSRPDVEEKSFLAMSFGGSVNL